MNNECETVMSNENSVEIFWLLTSLVQNRDDNEKRDIRTAIWFVSAAFPYKIL